MVDLSLQEMDAFLLAVERKSFPKDQRVLFESGLNKIRNAWVDEMKDRSDVSDDDIVKMVARDPYSPFKDMVYMSEAAITKAGSDR